MNFLVPHSRRWGPPKQSRFFRKKAFERFQLKRWYPEKVHEPFVKRPKRKRYRRWFSLKKIPRYIRENTNCGDVVLHSRFWLNKNRPGLYLTRAHLYAWDVRRGFIRPVKPKLIKWDDLLSIQPLTAPTGQIFTLKPAYVALNNGGVAEPG